MVVRNASSGPNITAGRMIIAFAHAPRTANSPSPRFRMYSDRERGSEPIPETWTRCFDPRSLRLNRYSSGSFDVHGMKCLITMLNVKTDSIHHCVSASNRISD